MRTLVLVLSVVAAQAAYGQSSPAPLVWVAEGELVALTRQLAGETVQVQPLSGRLTAKSSEQSARSILLCSDARSAEPLELLWRERLTAQGMPRIVVADVARCDGRSRQAGLLQELHAALVQISPEHRPQLNRNLQRELLRLQQLAFTPLLAQSP